MSRVVRQHDPAIEQARIAAHEVRRRLTAAAFVHEVRDGHDPGARDRLMVLAVADPEMIEIAEQRVLHAFGGRIHGRLAQIDVGETNMGGVIEGFRRKLVRLERSRECQILWRGCVSFRHGVTDRISAWSAASRCQVRYSHSGVLHLH